MMSSHSCGCGACSGGCADVLISFSFGLCLSVVHPVHPRSSGERDISITRDTLKDLMMCHAAIALGCSRSDLPDITFSCKFTMSRLPQIYSLGVRQHSAKSEVSEPMLPFLPSIFILSTIHIPYFFHEHTT